MDVERRIIFAECFDAVQTEVSEDPQKRARGIEKLQEELTT
jgi:hypothetical protein